MGQLDTTRQPGCELCERDGGTLVARTNKLRIIRADDVDHPAFYRVIWNDHIAEWTDLSAGERALMMSTVEAVEGVLREHLKPTKINLASLGNVVPHLHWHVIARFDWDARWPAPVWAPPLRQLPEPATSRLALTLSELDARIARTLQA